MQPIQPLPSAAIHSEVRTATLLAITTVGGAILLVLGIYLLHQASRIPKVYGNYTSPFHLSIGAENRAVSGSFFISIGALVASVGGWALATVPNWAGLKASYQNRFELRATQPFSVN